MLTFDKLNGEMQNFAVGETERSYTEHQLNYENEYISCRCYNSSNKWIDRTKDVMSKSWSIIYDRKKRIENLTNFMQLSRHYDIQVTPVKTGKNKGCYGIRIYGMKKKPTEKIIKMVLDYIFSSGN